MQEIKFSSGLEIKYKFKTTVLVLKRTVVFWYNKKCNETINFKERYNDKGQIEQRS